MTTQSLDKLQELKLDALQSIALDDDTSMMVIVRILKLAWGICQGADSNSTIGVLGEDILSQCITYARSKIVSGTASPNSLVSFINLIAELEKEVEDNDSTTSPSLSNVFPINYDQLANIVKSKV